MSVACSVHADSLRCVGLHDGCGVQLAAAGLLSLPPSTLASWYTTSLGYSLHFLVLLVKDTQVGIKAALVLLSCLGPTTGCIGVQCTWAGS